MKFRLGSPKANKQPAIGVVIAAYNAARTITEALDSLRAQTSQHWSALIVDDGSTDDTAAIVKKYCAKDRRFQL